jgi:hypothetical protein
MSPRFARAFFLLPDAIGNLCRQAGPILAHVSNGRYALKWIVCKRQAIPRG